MFKPLLYWRGFVILDEDVKIWIIIEALSKRKRKRLEKNLN